MTMLLNALPALIVGSILILDFLTRYQAWLNARPAYAYAKKEAQFLQEEEQCLYA